MRLNSLFSKTVFYYTISVLILLSFFTWAQHGSIRVTEDEVINNILQQEADAYFKRATTDPDAPLPMLENLTAVTEESGLPADFKNILSSLRDGIYETTGPASIQGPPSHNILIRTFPNHNNRLYLIYDAADVISRNTCALSSKSILALIFIFTAVISFLVIYVIGKIIFRPLNSLSAQLREYGVQDIERKFPESERNDEIGLLAFSIQSSFQRLQKFIRREREFTRDASHELRTPLTVIKGAAELLQSSCADVKNLQRPLARIERSAENMEKTIETLLWLAREEDNHLAGSSFEIPETVRKAVFSITPLAESKNISITTEIGCCLSNKAPEQVLLIVLTNILNNAINFTQGGTISIKAAQSMITIMDTGEGISHDLIKNMSTPYTKGKNSSGFGLGLSIVKRLCNRFGWEVCISARKNGGTSVSVDISETAENIPDAKEHESNQKNRIDRN